MGVAALVLGILGILLSLVPSFGVTQMIGVVLGIVALILGIIGRKQAVDEGRATGMTTAGLVLGIVAMVFSALLFAACKYCQHKVEQGINNGEFQQQFRKGLQEGLRRQQEELERRRKLLQRTPGGGGAGEP